MLRRYFVKYPEDAERVAINIKGGRDFKTLGFDGSPEGVARSIEHSLEQLGPVGRISQWGMARRDLSHDYEDETLASIDGYVKSGRIDGISTSEINATTLRSAARKFRISALEIEVSLFHTDALTNGLCAACAELDIPVIAYCKYLVAKTILVFSFAGSVLTILQPLSDAAYSAAASRESTTSL